MATVELQLVQPDYGFKVSDAFGHSVNFDTSPENGGQNFGVRPMQTLLMALAGCSGIDVISILKKKRQTVTSFRIKVDGEREQGELPALWKKVHMVFYISGEVDDEKARHAISLSIEKYCSVAETLRRSGCEITWQVVLEEF